MKVLALDLHHGGEAANPAPEKILAGIPRARAANQYSDATGQFHCGWWSSSVGKWRVNYTESEFCVLIEGRVRLESSDHERADFRAGDAFVVPSGFTGSWEVLEACRKWYAIFEPSGS